MNFLKSIWPSLGKYLGKPYPKTPLNYSYTKKGPGRKAK